jgi:parallel beta-helix repeat protein
MKLKDNKKDVDSKGVGIKIIGIFCLLTFAGAGSFLLYITENYFSSTVAIEKSNLPILSYGSETYNNTFTSNLNFSNDQMLDLYFKNSVSDGLSWETAYEFTNLSIITIEHSDLNLTNISRYLIISNCYFESLSPSFYYYNDYNKYSCIFIENSRNIMIQNCTFNNNFNGISIYSSSNVFLTNNLLKNHSHNGIYLDSSENVEIYQNHFVKCVIGINLLYSSNCYVEKNQIVDSYYYGINIRNSDNNKIMKNVITNETTWHGIYLTRSSFNIIDSNIIYHIAGSGISIGHGTVFNTISNNILLLCSDGGISWPWGRGDLSDAWIDFNLVYGNSSRNYYTEGMGFRWFFMLIGNIMIFKYFKNQRIKLKKSNESNKYFCHFLYISVLIIISIYTGLIGAL